MATGKPLPNMRFTPSLRLETVLEKADAVRPQLHQAADELNAALVKVEEAITGMQLGVRAHLHLRGDEITNENLTILKQGKAWRLYKETFRADQPGESTIEPLVSCSREFRLLAVGQLPAFVAELVKEAERELQRVQESTAKTLSFVERLNGGGK
jgi:hypothetical protein